MTKWTAPFTGPCPPKSAGAIEDIDKEAREEATDKVGPFYSKSWQETTSGINDQGGYHGGYRGGYHGGYRGGYHGGYHGGHH